MLCSVEYQNKPYLWISSYRIISLAEYSVNSADWSQLQQKCFESTFLKAAFLVSEGRLSWLLLSSAGKTVGSVKARSDTTYNRKMHCSRDADTAPLCSCSRGATLMQTGKLRKIVGNYTNNSSHFQVFHKSQTGLYGLLICEVVSLGAEPKIRTEYCSLGFKDVTAHDARINTTGINSSNITLTLHKLFFTSSLSIILFSYSPIADFCLS